MISAWLLLYPRQLCWFAWPLHSREFLCLRQGLFSLELYVFSVGVSVSLYILKMCMSRELETLNWSVGVCPYICDGLESWWSIFLTFCPVCQCMLRYTPTHDLEKEYARAWSRFSQPLITHYLMLLILLYNLVCIPEV